MGFWNLYRYERNQEVNLCEMEAEFAPPPWVFGMPSYAFVDDGSLICAITENGDDFLGLLDPSNRSVEKLDTPYTAISNVVAWKGKVYFFGGSPNLPTSIVCYDPKKQVCTTIKESFCNPFPKEQISIPESIAFETADGYVGHALYYPPKNPRFQPPKGELPPLLVKVHGGPTARSPNQLSLTVQYWASRGYAFLDVNYGGSTGFGRAYMKRLEGNWGIVDVDDVIRATRALVGRGLADFNRLLIHGGSAGGYTTLAALAFHDIFAGGTSLFGIGDIEMFCKGGHKFEEKYSDMLVAPYPTGVNLIRERSPINHVDKMSRPTLILQGDQDTIVPPSQSIAIFEALKEKKIPTGILIFEGEGHGFKKADTIKKSLDAQLYFYADILGIELSEPFKNPPVAIIR
jgi:dipeptidyl aminopeptidase/acylaminoacyl peptidase